MLLCKIDITCLVRWIGERKRTWVVIGFQDGIWSTNSNKRPIALGHERVTQAGPSARPTATHRVDCPTGDGEGEEDRNPLTVTGDGEEDAAAASGDGEGDVLTLKP